MKARKLSSGNWNCRIMVNGKSYSFTDPDRRRCLRRASEFAEQCREDVDNPRLADALESFVESRSADLSPATVRGYAHGKYTALKNSLMLKRMELEAIRAELELLQYAAADFIASGLPFEEHEIRLLLMELLPLSGLIRTWEEIGQAYKEKYNMRVESDALRVKLARFLK